MTMMSDEAKTDDGEQKGLSKILKSWWVVGAGALAALAAALTSLNTIASQARALPGEWGQTGREWSRWYYEYEQWPGRWTYFPEGWADMAQHNLTDEKFRLDIGVDENGAIEGTIETQGICKKVPWFDSLMVDGEITGPGTAELAVWDLVGGYRREFATLKIVRDDFVMTVRPVSDPSGIFREETRIGRDPDEFLGEDYPRDPFCGDKKTKFLMKATEQESESDRR